PGGLAGDAGRVDGVPAGAGRVLRPQPRPRRPPVARALRRRRDLTRRGRADASLTFAMRRGETHVIARSPPKTHECRNRSTTCFDPTVRVATTAASAGGGRSRLRRGTYVGPACDASRIPSDGRA